MGDVERVEQIRELAERYKAAPNLCRVCGPVTDVSDPDAHEPDCIFGALLFLLEQARLP